ncbi:MAG: glutathione peroxidase [bacterium]|nr:glutathione peroxidase [bacterium]
MLFNFLGLPLLTKGQPSSSIHDFTVRSIDGERVDLSTFRGKKILIVNTASKCGFTPQYKQLEELYEKYKEHNFVIIGFPSNDFGKQEPGTNEEISSFCERNYGVKFPMMEKITVIGEGIHPLYKWLTTKSQNGVMNSKVRWNFQKYMIDENGHLVDYVVSWKKPNCRKIEKWLRKSVR